MEKDYHCFKIRCSSAEGGTVTGGLLMRRSYIDNLRWLLIFLLIPYHAAMAWNAWGEPNYIIFGSSRLFSSIIVFLSPWLMPLFFLLAGMSTKYALQKRTVKQYILERAQKLMVPFAFGTLLFMPLMTYIAHQFNDGYNGSVFGHYAIFFTKVTDLTGADGCFSIGQFWFILYLFVISLVGAGIITLQKRMLTTYVVKIPLWLICLWGLPLPILNSLLSIGGKSFAEYTYIFLAGYYIFSNDTVVYKVERCKWFFLCTGLLAAVLNVYLFLWSDVPSHLLNTMMKYLSESFMPVALLGIGRRYFTCNGKVATYLSQRSFAFYMFHYIWVVLLQSLLAECYGSNTVLLYLMPILGAYLATLVCCELCMRVPVLRFFTGKRRND